MIYFVSWNVNSIRIRLPVVLYFLKQYKPDVVMLQETKVKDDLFPKIDGYKAFIYGQPAYNGVAVLVKEGLDVVSWQKFDLGDKNDARCIKVDLKDFAVFSVYVPNGDGSKEKYEYKKEFLANLCRLSSESGRDKQVVFGGDFNVARTDADIEFPERFAGTAVCAEDVRSLFNDFIITNNLTDHGHKASVKNDFTWWDYRMYGLALSSGGLRIDYLLTNLNGEYSSIRKYRDFRIKTLSVNGSIETKPSDHIPICLEM